MVIDKKGMMFESNLQRRSQLRTESHLGIVLMLTFISACSVKEEPKGTPALFNTKQEAEQAAKRFNCSGAHKMGSKWMPCKKQLGHHNH